MKFWGFSYLDVKKQKINSILKLTWKKKKPHKELLDLK